MTVICNVNAMCVVNPEKNDMLVLHVRNKKFVALRCKIPLPRCVPSDTVSQSATVVSVYAHFVVLGLFIMHSK